LPVIPADPAPVEDAYAALARRGELGAYWTEHRYYSVGGHERLPLTEEFFRRRPTVILDRDGVLNERPPRAQYVRSPDEFAWLPGALESLRLLTHAGYRTIVVSNQAGVNRGAMTHEDVSRVHERMRADAERAGARIDAVYYCPHDWDEGCACRKPLPGMLFAAQREYSLDLTRTPMVGDDERDGKAARAAGCPFLAVDGERSLLDHVLGLVTHQGAEAST
jgi:D-glycero-D-manno-heptose 1,7-bisphosphate phosphatase